MAVRQLVALEEMLGTSDRGVDLSDGAIDQIRTRDEIHAHKMLTRIRLRVQIVKRRKRFILKTTAVFGVFVGAYNSCWADASSGRCAPAQRGCGRER